MTAVRVSKGSPLLGRLGTWFMVLATGSLLFVLGVESFNAIYFYFVIFPTPAGGKQPRRPVFVGVVHE